MKKKLLIFTIALLIVAAAVFCFVTKPFTDEIAGQCQLSISCATISDSADNLKILKENKQSLVPADGWLLAPIEISFTEGETVLGLMQRIAKQEKLHLDVMDGSFVSAIGNLYGGDCGELSGWMCKTNGEFGMSGANEIVLQDGDIIEFQYTCDMGADLGYIWEEK